jgi:hypothetical protein
MNITKRQLAFIVTSIVIALFWIFIPDVNSSSESCYHRFFGDFLTYSMFNKAQFFYFWIVIFVLVLFRRVLSLTGFIVIKLLLILPVAIKAYIWLCAH